MSGSINYLTLFGGGSASAGGNLLTTLYGSGAASAAAAGGNPITALTQAEAQQTQGVKAAAKQPQVARDIAGFRAALAGAKTPSELFANPAALKVLLTANGLADQVPYTALAKKVLLSDSKDPKSLVSKLGNTAWTKLVKTFDFAGQGLATLKKAGVADSIANGYAEVSWRQSLDAATPGLSNALTFKAQAASVTSALQILGDPVLRDVVTTALGIPKQLAFQSVDTQTKAIASRLDVSKLAKPQFVNSLTDRYLLAKQAEAAGTSTTPSLDQIIGQSAGLIA